MIRLRFLMCAVVFIAASARGDEKVGVKVDDISTKDETQISIKKGPSNKTCVAYEIIDGSDEVFGSPEFDKSKAYASWKTACSDWKKAMREMNAQNGLISLNCNSPLDHKEGEQHIFKSAGSYKVRVKTQDTK